MREIKFRAWDKEEKRMFSGEGYNKTLYFLASWLEAHSKDNPLTNKKQDSILLQFTGLEDKNGKEIYEGDIVKYTGYSAYGRDSKTSQVLIEWDDKGAGFNLGWLTKPDDGDIGLSVIDIEVIGNIYENPELLKEIKK